MPLSLSTFLIVLWATVWPTCFRDPSILRYPQDLLVRAIWTISAAMCFINPGRPTRRCAGQVHFAATRRRCQRRMVSGVTMEAKSPSSFRPISWPQT